MNKDICRWRDILLIKMFGSVVVPKGDVRRYFNILNKVITEKFPLELGVKRLNSLSVEDFH